MIRAVQRKENRLNFVPNDPFASARKARIYSACASSIAACTW